MDHSLFGEAASSVALLSVIFGPLAWSQRREIRAWWHELLRDIERARDDLG